MDNKRSTDGHPDEQPDSDELEGSCSPVHHMDSENLEQANRHDSIASLHDFLTSHPIPQDLQKLIVRQASHFTESSIIGEANMLEESMKEKPPLTKRQIFTLITILFATVCSASFYSLLAPFFATEASKKGASETEIGFIFGCFQAIIFVMAPIYGRFITKIGPKFMFVMGIFVSSSCAILFGCLEWCPDGKVYVGMCFLVRGIEAFATAATSTASLAIAAHTFPERLSTVMGILEVGSSIGLMLGPPIGGLLFSVGGFHLPFFVSGSLFMCASVLSFFLLPELTSTDQKKKTPPGIGLLKLPIVLIVGYMVCVGQASIGFMDVGLAKHIEQFDLSAAIVGLMFLIPSASVIILAPINGTVVDKNKKYGQPIIAVGCLVGTIGLLGLGPSALLPFFPHNELWVPALSLAIAGVGLSALVVTYQEFVTAAKTAGFPITMEMQGIISGLYNSFNSLGAFVGPTFGGIMLENIGFDWSVTIYGIGLGLVGVALAVYSICRHTCCKPRTIGRNWPSINA